MSFHVDNGILAKIPGELIGQGSQSLPPAGFGQPERLHVEIDAGHLGKVRITYELKSSRRGKWTNWFWNACFAEVVEKA
jgi:hypothetical protein